MQTLGVALASAEASTLGAILVWGEAAAVLSAVERPCDGVTAVGATHAGLPRWLMETCLRSSLVTTVADAVRSEGAAVVQAVGRVLQSGVATEDAVGTTASLPPQQSHRAPPLDAEPPPLSRHALAHCRRRAGTAAFAAEGAETDFGHDVQTLCVRAWGQHARAAGALEEVVGSAAVFRHAASTAPAVPEDAAALGRERRSLRVVALYMGAATHDSNMAIAEGGRVLAVLELERLFEQRYFAAESRTDAAGTARFEEQLRRAFRALLWMAGGDGGDDTPAAAAADGGGDGPAETVAFDVALYPNGMEPGHPHVQAMQRVVRAQRWLTYDHHEAHAMLGFYDSPFETALVASFDGGGNDGLFNIYLAHRTGAASAPAVAPRHCRLPPCAGCGRRCISRVHFHGLASRCAGAGAG